MRNFLNARAQALKPSGIRKFFDLVSRTEGAISLGVGEPDFITAENVRASAVRSIERGETQYTANRGLDSLCGLISEYLFRRFSVCYPPEHIIVTVGASEAIDLALRAVVGFGDEVLVPEPSYVAYAPLITLSGGTAVAVPCKKENGFILTYGEIEKKVTDKTKALILAYPNNPTGAVMTKEHLQAIIPAVVKNDLLVISDEIYAELSYCGKHVSISSIGDMAERTVYIGGFSKAFAMTGWRVGFVCAPEKIDEAMFKIHQYALMCAPRASQCAALEALKSGLKNNFSDVEKMKEEYRRRGEYLAGELNALSLECAKPCGAFYVFPSVESTGMDGDEFSYKLLKEQKVAVVGGSAFGESGRNFIRCSYSASMENIKTAVQRISQFIGVNKKC